MNQLQTFENELFKVFVKSENDQNAFDVEQVAKSLGIISKTTTNGIAYENVRWSRVNEYIGHLLPHVAEIKKGDFIPEPLVYKLAFKASNDVAEKFQDWLAIEVIPSIRKTGSYQAEQPKSQSELMLMYAEQFVNQEKEIKMLKGSVDQANQKIENVSNIVSINNVGWREKVNVILKKIASKWTGVEPYRSVKQLSYERFETRAGCKLELRLNNRKERALSQGMAKSHIRKINKLDVISEEKRLVEIYIQVVKEMAIQFRVNISDFKFDEVI